MTLEAGDPGLELALGIDVALELSAPLPGDLDGGRRALDARLGLGLDSGFALGGDLRRLDGAFAAACAVDVGIGRGCAFGFDAGLALEVARVPLAGTLAFAAARTASGEVAGAFAHAVAGASTVSLAVDDRAVAVAGAVAGALAGGGDRKVAGTGAGA
ncbi:MAG TPA: hypothetical protein ENJ18_06405 [Nannocystis exedens]|nr:hypothetical protein [Nannocystis exedens]